MVSPKDVAASTLLDMIDPELRDAAETLRLEMSRFSPMSLELLAERRAWIASRQEEPLSEPPISLRRIARAAAPDLVLYVVNARSGDAKPGILHMHGGGFTTGTALGSLRRLQKLAAELDCTIVTVDYRLAPEATFKESTEDDYASLLWMHLHASEIGVDPDRIAILGESAGGGHAALLTSNARDRGEVPVLFQMLVYPMLDDRTGSSRIVPEHMGAFGWSADDNRFGWQCFLGQEPGARHVPTEAVPARRSDLRGLPPTFIAVGALDLFVDECVNYARRLIDDRVPTELLVVPGAFHGFDTAAPGAAVSQRFTSARVAALKRAFVAPSPREQE